MTHHGAVGKAIRAYNESFNSFFVDGSFYKLRKLLLGIM